MSESRINEAVNLIARRSPRQLQALREAFPALTRTGADELQAGVVCGDTADDSARLLQAGGVMKAALVVAMSEAKERIEKLARNVRKSQWIVFAVDAISLVAGVGVLGALGLNEAKIATVTAIVAVLLGLLKLASGRAITLIDPSVGDATGVFSKLVTLREKAAGMIRTIELLYASSPSSEALTKIVQDGNDLCAEINTLSQIAGY